MATALYAILDTTAQDIVQNVVTVQRHDAPMVRMFTDLLENKQGPIGQHPADYQLVRLGWLIEPPLQLDDLPQVDPHQLHYSIAPSYAVILDGKAWLAMQRQPENGKPLEPERLEHLRERAAATLHP